MPSRGLMAIMLWAIGLCASLAVSGQTLHPIVSSNTSTMPPPTLRTKTGDPNQVDAKSVISIALKPTAIGPPGAGGVAEIKGRAVSLHIGRLEPGRYQLQLVRRSDGSIKPLGTLTIADPTLGPDRHATDNKKEASANPESVLIETDVQMKLPSPISPHDIARVLVLGPGGNAVLAGAVK